MKIFAVILIALVGLVLWLGFLFVRYKPQTAAEQSYGAPLQEALNAVFSPLDASATTPAGQIQALMERAGKDTGEGRKEIAELSRSLSRQLLAVNEERERHKARLRQINATEVKTLTGSSQAAQSKQSQPAPHLKPGGKVKRIGQDNPVRQAPASQPSPSKDKSFYAAAEKQRWAQYVSSARPQCEETLRKIVAMERSPSRTE